MTKPVTEENPLGVSTGYLFGYLSDNIQKGDFEYFEKNHDPEALSKLTSAQSSSEEK